jgi:hypothetical protein
MYILFWIAVFYTSKIQSTPCDLFNASQHELKSQPIPSQRIARGIVVVRLAAGFIDALGPIFFVDVNHVALKLLTGFRSLKPRCKRRLR